MSYCRFIEADVYVFFSASGLLECCGCGLAVEPDGEWWGSSFVAGDTETMIQHLERHREKGDFVPQEVFVEILNDDARNFPPEE